MKTTTDAAEAATSTVKTGSSPSASAHIPYRTRRNGAPRRPLDAPPPSGPATFSAEHCAEFLHSLEADLPATATSYLVTLGGGGKRIVQPVAPNAGMVDLSDGQDVVALLSAHALRSDVLRSIGAYCERVLKSRGQAATGRTEVDGAGAEDPPTHPLGPAERSVGADAVAMTAELIAALIKHDDELSGFTKRSMLVRSLELAHVAHSVLDGGNVEEFYMVAARVYGMGSVEASDASAARIAEGGAA